MASKHVLYASCLDKGWGSRGTRIILNQIYIGHAFEFEVPKIERAHLTVASRVKSSTTFQSKEM